MRASAAVGWWIMASCVAARTAFSRDNEPPPPRSSYILSYLISYRALSVRYYRGCAASRERLLSPPLAVSSSSSTPQITPLR
jgi:hypothetical protein